jgi:hypothetical protein
MLVSVQVYLCGPDLPTNVVSSHHLLTLEAFPASLLEEILLITLVRNMALVAGDFTSRLNAKTSSLVERRHGKVIEWWEAYGHVAGAGSTPRHPAAIV